MITFPPSESDKAVARAARAADPVAAAFAAEIADPAAQARRLAQGAAAQKARKRYSKPMAESWKAIAVSHEADLVSDATIEKVEAQIERETYEPTGHGCRKMRRMPMLDE